MMILTDYLENTEKKYGDKVVIKEPDCEITYSELMIKARNIGFNISRGLSGKRNVPIGIFIEKGCDCLAAILGVVYSGNCYVPMDIKTPKDRLESILDTMGSDLVICNEKSMTMMEKTQMECSILNYESLIEISESKEEQDTVLSKIRSEITDVDLMYILFTSGSTGIPKGVAIMHRSVDDYIRAFVHSVPIDSSDVIGNQVPFYVDMSLKDICMSIAVGATIVVIPQTYFMSPKKILNYLEDNKVTLLMWVPTAYSIISRFDGLSHVRAESIKKILFSGESMPISVFNYWKKHYPEAVYVQLYGPTEITGACTSFTVDKSYSEEETIPIGKPFPNTGILLVSDDDTEIARDNTDDAGEICVYGSCLAAGYYNNPEKTRESFVQNPLIKTHPSIVYRTGDLAKWDDEGNLVFISRKDFQIKHGGRRIELGEIESAVDSIDEIYSSCCVHDADSDTIVLFYVGDITDVQIKTQLKSKIPPYMIPAKLISMEVLPTLPNGKLDRKKMTGMAKEEV